MSSYTDFKIHNIDCRSIIEKLIYESKNPIIVTDPPYNIGYHYGSYGDKMQEDDYWAMLTHMGTLCPSVWVMYPRSLHRLSSLLGVPDEVCSWVYNANTPHQHRDIGFYGVIPDFNKRRQPYKNPKDRRIRERPSDGARLYDWWEIQQVKNVSADKTAHPCQMPVPVMENVVGILPDDITVIDPFMGSGTTGVACAHLGIPFVGVEMDPDYFSIAQDRLEREFAQGRLF